MGRRQGPNYARRWIGAVLLVTLCSGCAIGVATGSGVATILNTVFLIGVTSGASYDGATPGLEPSRRVTEQDCSKPIEDLSANLKCR